MSTSITKISKPPAMPEKYVRAVYLNNPDDPYYIAHSNSECLYDDHLKSLRLAYLAILAKPVQENNPDLEENEIFEIFLGWLTQSHGYEQLFTADLIYKFEE